MPFIRIGYQTLKETVQQLTVKNATSSSLSSESQLMAMESLDGSQPQHDKANFSVNIIPRHCAQVYPTDDPKLPGIVNDFLLLLHPFNTSTAPSSLGEKIVKFRPVITAALKELTPNIKVKIAYRVLVYLSSYSSSKDVKAMARVMRHIHGPSIESLFLNKTAVAYFIKAIIKVMPSNNTQQGSSYFRHILVLILLSVLYSSSTAAWDKIRDLLYCLKEQISIITSLNLSPHFPFLLLAEYNDPLYTPLSYTLIFNAELKSFILDENKRSTYIMSPIRPILLNQTFSNVNLSGRNLAHLTFFKVKFFNVSFANANLRNTNFIDCEFSNVNFNGANLIQANLSKCDLRECDLSEADLHRANLTEVNLTQVKLTQAYLDQARLNGAKLEGADLTKTVLTRASLNKANLSGAKLDGADLSKVVLTETNLLYSFGTYRITKREFNEKKPLPDSISELNRNHITRRELNEKKPLPAKKVTKMV